MADAPRRYSLCGWHVLSDIALPELPEWAGAPGEPDLVFALGDVPAEIPDPVLHTPYMQANRAGQVRHALPGVAEYLIEHGRRITIHARMDPDSADIRLFLLGSVFGILCNQRGVLPLHACAVEVDGGAIAFAGASGTGKSTLAAAFHRRGFRLFADDVTPVDFSEGGVRFLPGLRRIRLWQDSVAGMGWQPDGLERCREGLDKFSRAFDSGFTTEAVKPIALFHLRRAAGTSGEISFTRLQGVDAVQQARRQVYRWRTLQRATGKAEATARVLRAAAGIPRHFELWRPVNYDALDATIDAVLETVRANR